MRRHFLVYTFQVTMATGGSLPARLSSLLGLLHGHIQLMDDDESIVCAAAVLVSAGSCCDAIVRLMTRSVVLGVVHL